MWPWVASVCDQGSTSSCVGQALANAVTIREAVCGYGWNPASALFAYWYARYKSGAGIVDDGTYIRSACNVMVKLGIPDEKYWPMSSWKVNRQPPPSATMQAHPRSGGVYVGIFDIGSMRADAVKACIAADIPVIAGFRIDDAFVSDSGPEVIDTPYAPRYGHAMAIIGYKPDPTHVTLYEILNSWGYSWRKGGRAWLTEAYLRSTSRVGDLTAVHGWKRITGPV